MSLFVTCASFYASSLIFSSKNEQKIKKNQKNPAENQKKSKNSFAENQKKSKKIAENPKIFSIKN